MRKLPTVILSIVLICFLSTICHAQSTAVTSDGKKVLLNADGTWIYILETDSMPAPREAELVRPVVADAQPVDTATVAKPVVVLPPPKPPVVLDCPVLVSFERDITSDKYVGATRIQKVANDSKSGLTISFIKSKSNPLRWSTTIHGGDKCVAEEDKMKIVFKDGTTLVLENDGKVNCDGVFMLYFGGIYGKEDPLEAMRKTEIEGIRVVTKKGYTEANFSEDDSKIFRAALNCLLSGK